MSEITLNFEAQKALQRLMRVWFDFERQLSRLELIRRLDLGTFTLEDYRRLLLNLRQQVIEGSRWISRGASSFDASYSDVRSIVIGHAKEEHLDYELLESDYVAAGGDLAEIQARSRNIGSEALHGYIMYRASLGNPIDLLGAMWIIEGLGMKMAESWAERIDELTNGDGRYTRFMRYHGSNDDTHMEKLYRLLNRLCTDEHHGDKIVKTAEVVARLYALQIDEAAHE